MIVFVLAFSLYVLGYGVVRTIDDMRRGRWLFAAWGATIVGVMALLIEGMTRPSY